MNEEKEKKEMDKIAVDNLHNIIHVCKFPHICLSYSDINQFINIPQEDKSFYQAHWKWRHRSVEGKRGFFNGGQTTVWECWDMDTGTIRIGTRPVAEISITSSSFFGSPHNWVGWSSPFPFTETDSLLRIHKYMKLKAFW